MSHLDYQGCHDHPRAVRKIQISPTKTGKITLAFSMYFLIDDNNNNNTGS